MRERRTERGSEPVRTMFNHDNKGLREADRPRAVGQGDIIRSFLASFLARALLLVVASAAAAGYQQPAAKESGKTQDAEQAEAHPAPSDPMGRDTPHGTVLGFLQAAQSGKYQEASQYLRLSKRERAPDGEDLARHLQPLMDRAF